MEKIKTTINCFFFVVNEAGEKVTQPIVIWKSQLPRCFKKFQDTSRPANLHYFSNPKSWMTSEVIEAPLVRFNKKLAFEPRKVFFLSIMLCVIQNLWIGQFSYIKVLLLPKNTTLWLQQLDAGIIQNFKSSTKRDWLSMCSQGSSRMHLQHKLSRVWMYLWLFDDYKKRGKK